MNIALCLYGHFRSFDTCWPELRDNLLIPNQINDIFAVSWSDSMGYFQHPEISVDHKRHPGYDPVSGNPSQEYISSVLERLKPIDHAFHDYHAHDQRFSEMVDRLHDWHHPSVHHRPKGTLGQVWGRCASIDLKRQHEWRTGIRYDRVVVTRWDIAYSAPINLDALNQYLLSTDGMYGPDVISDAWACGPSHLVDLWGEQFACIDELVSRKTMNLGPHEWLKAHFNMMAMAWESRPDIGIWIRR
jgi:hypothetical protein